MDVNLTSEGKVKLEPGMELPFSYQVCVRYAVVLVFTCKVYVYGELLHMIQYMYNVRVNVFLAR